MENHEQINVKVPSHIKEWVEKEGRYLGLNGAGGAVRFWLVAMYNQAQATGGRAVTPGSEQPRQAQ